MFVDRVKIHCKAGKGGDGIVAFRREKYVALGGPSGGDGGKGGSVIFEVDTGKFTLLDLRYSKKVIASDGEKGKAKKMHGANGKDVVVKVPLGTIVKVESTGAVIADLTHPGQRAIICAGGKGGRGNFHFKSSVNSAPEYCEMGEFGDEKDVIVELKVLADVGLVGFPSVGKSTLLSVVSKAKPEIAEYHFTTLKPHLGMVQVPDGRSFVMADLPGLIEGASQGKGLGHEFLRHIERCRVIIHVVDMGANDGRDPVEDFYKVIYDYLKGNFKVFYATLEDKIVAASLILYANKQVHYHLSGSLSKYRNLAPTNLLLYQVALWGQEHGFKTLHLGGGLGSGNDNLYKFKAAFNRNSGLQFSIGKHIFNQELYDKLVNLRLQKDPNFNVESKFFPLYRDK